MDDVVDDDLQGYYRARLVEHASRLERARRALAGGDREAGAAIRRAAHRLKGTGATYGFAEVSLAAGRLLDAGSDRLEETLDALIEILRRAAGDDRDAAAAAVSGDAVGAGKKLLLVDDDPDLRILASHVLEKLGGFKVLSSAGGWAAVELARRELPDVILMDVLMPPPDGVELAARLAADRRTAELDLIFLTGESSRSEHRRLLALGARGVIVKPFDPERLHLEVERLLYSSQDTVR